MKTVASFDIKYQRFLEADGTPTGPLPSLAKRPDELVELYKLMVLTRTFDTKAVALQRTGKLGTYASCLGHEAAHIGIGSAMAEDDVFCPMYREYGAQFYRGVKMEDVLLYWGGDERGNDFAGPKKDFAWSVPIATQNMHAAGVAMAMKIRNEQRAAVTVIGDGGSSKGDFYEAMNAAGAFDLPVLFVVVNNQWAISVPRSAQTGTKTLAQKGIAAGIPAIQVDGNDILAVRWAADAALKRARAGKGATLIEAVTYRLSDHTTADDASRYRDDAEVEAAWKREPMIRTRNFLIKQGHWSDEQEEAHKAECSKQVEQAVANYLDTPVQPTSAMFDYMYAELPEDLAAQRDQAIEEHGA